MPLNTQTLNTMHCTFGLLLLQLLIIENQHLWRRTVKNVIIGNVEEISRIKLYDSRQSANK